MKDLLSKEHYCHKVHTILIKSNAYRSPSIMIIIIINMIFIILIIINIIVTFWSIII